MFLPVHRPAQVLQLQEPSRSGMPGLPVRYWQCAIHGIHFPVCRMLQKGEYKSAICLHSRTCALSPHITAPFQLHEFDKTHTPRTYTVSDEFRRMHKPQPMRLLLTAVICIRHSHYVSFVRAGDRVASPWVFFDSMFERKGKSLFFKYFFAIHTTLLKVCFFVSRRQSLYVLCTWGQRERVGGGGTKSRSCQSLYARL